MIAVLLRDPAVGEVKWQYEANQGCLSKIPSHHRTCFNLGRVISIERPRKTPSWYTTQIARTTSSQGRRRAGDRRSSTAR